MSQREDLTGKQFELLTVIGFYERNKHRKSVWKCLCACGKNTLAISSELKNGHKKSCGCLNGESHGWHGTPEYNAWKAMKGRCYNQNKKSFLLYGGRGIKVCDRWLNSFKNFLKDMGKRPSPRHSLDRINVDGDYEPNNCRWADDSVQNANKRFKTEHRSSEYIGVCKNGKTWTSYVQIYGKRYNFCGFETPKEAAIARNKYIIENNLPNRLNAIVEDK